MFWTKTSCAAFLANYDLKYSVRVTFQNLPYDLPPWSVSILPDCKTVVFNTAKVKENILFHQWITKKFPIFSLKFDFYLWTGCFTRLASKDDCCQQCILLAVVQRRNTFRKLWCCIYQRWAVGTDKCHQRCYRLLVVYDRVSSCDC